LKYAYSRAAILLSALSLTALLLPVPAARAQDTYTIKRAYKAGETDKYRINLQLQGESPMGPLNLEMTMDMIETTKQILEDGSVVVEMRMDSGAIKFNDQEMSMPGAGETMRMTIDKTGRVVKTEGGAAGRGGNLNGLINLTRVATWPDRPLRVGETWTFEVPLENNPQAKVKGSFTVVGPEKKNDEIKVDTLKVKIATEIPIPAPQGDPAKIKIDSLVYIEPGTGKVMKAEGSGSGQLGPLGQAKMKFTRVRVEK
jgi:hypothetical protein